ncbi:hypothetical protein VKT23_007563 [Stygiomarasmius scandens]|uniref:RRM domain-containing protein n=1 Tax=Marasmiellus scandens TaxID=2682957 RepID=A0ABR1JKU8_9AGAR
MDVLRPDPSTSRSPSLSASPPIPVVTPSNDDIEAIIQMATSSRSSPDGRPGPPKDTRTQLFVGNLPYRVRWQDLKDLFRKAGTVLRADVSLGPDNRSRGYGTVLLATAEDAGRAIDMFNGYSWQTRILEVRPDRLPPDLDNSTNMSTAPSTSIPAVSGLLPFASSLNPLGGLGAEIDYSSLLGLDRPSSSAGTGGRNLFVGNLPFHCQWQDLKDLFRQAGTIIRADVALGQDGRSRGFGTVVFATEYDADRAVKMFNGYEYNGRALKVHYDKFSQSTQPMTTPASPNVASFSSSISSPFQLGAQTVRPNHIVMPTGYTLDFGPASGPTTPYDYQPHLQMSMHPHHTQSHIHQPQPFVQRRDPLSQTSLLKDVDVLSNALQSTNISRPVPSSKARSTSSSDSESIRRSTSSGQESSSSVSSVSPQSESAHPTSKSPPALHSHSQAHSPRPLNPHHPGPISIPPPPPVSSFTMPMPMHNMSPMGLPMSPHYYAGMSPLHHPAHGIPMTPHGLPPITPSMPPFTFLPPMPLASPAYEAVMGDLSLNGTSIPHQSEGTPTGQFPQSVGENDSSTSLSPRPSTPTHNSIHAHTDTSSNSTTSPPRKSNVEQSNINPYFQSRPRPYPDHPHPHPAHAHLAQLTPFSPGLAMSPGAFWGRPGAAGPNPYINLAVGAPVHAGQLSPGGFYFHPHSPGVPGSVGVEMGSRGGGEPGGYFDSAMSQGYFPPVPGNVQMPGMAYGVPPPGAVGGYSVEGEILKDKKDKEEDRERRDREEKGAQSVETSPSSNSGSVWAPSIVTSPDDGEASGADDESRAEFSHGVQDHQGPISRAHSLSSSMMKRPIFGRPGSDPAHKAAEEQSKAGARVNERSESLQS